LLFGGRVIQTIIFLSGPLFYFFPIWEKKERVMILKAHIMVISLLFLLRKLVKYMEWNKKL